MDKHEKHKRKQMRLLLAFIFILFVINLVFDLSLPHYVWVISFFLLSILSLIQIMDTKLRSLDERLNILEKSEKKDEPN